MEKLKKELTLFDVFAISTGAMISSGLFVLPGLAYAKSGPAVILAYILAGLMYIPAMLSYAELGTAMPRSGGSYFVVDRSMGPVLGTIGGMSEWLSLVLKSSFALIGMGAFMIIIFPNLGDMQMKLIAAGLCVLFTILNLVGVKEAGKMQKIMVTGMLLILAVYIIEGFTKLDPHNFAPFMPYGKFSVFATAGLVYISFAGLTKIVNVGEEIRNPGRNIPLGMFLAFSVVTLIYALSVLVTVGLVPGDDLSKSLIPLVMGAERSMGVAGKIILALAAVFSFATTANAGIMAASRTPVSMSRDGHLPEFFQKIHAKSRVPRNAILVTSGIMLVFILLLDITSFVKTASVIMLALFTLISIAVIIMRESKMYNYKPVFRSPFYPYVQIIGVVAYISLMFTAGWKPLAIGGGILLVGIVWHWVYARIQINRESALVYALERFMDTEYDRDLAADNLDHELREIIKERDEIVEDHFDRMVKHADVIDLPGKTSREELLKEIAKDFAARQNLDEKKLYGELAQRESESTSIISPGVAMPHILFEGKCSFSLLLIRSRDGIELGHNLPPAHAVFAFLGSRDMRALYLRSIVAVAEIARQEDFMEYWMTAKTNDDLRNIVLMGERNRVHLIFCRHCPEETMFEDRVLCKLGECGEGEDNGVTDQ